MYNHAFLLLAFESFFVNEATEATNAHLENFVNDFCERRVQNNLRRHRDGQAKIFFEMLYRIYGKERVAEFITQPCKGETMVHKAARSGLYSLVTDVMIAELGFDIDFWEPNVRLTVIN